jgi:hypothetical protein
MPAVRDPMIALLAVLLSSQPAAAQAPLTVQELAHYRLSPAVFERFDRASRRLAEAVAADPRLVADPPFTRAIAVLDDAADAAATLERRLSREWALASALGAAGMPPREYTTFAISLIGARLAHGFVKSGAMRFVPPGVAADNVAFIDAHEREVAAILRLLGVE